VLASVLVEHLQFLRQSEAEVFLDTVPLRPFTGLIQA
jgi:hypothetical protein